ncbi:MAG: glycosyltransferase family 2 protein [Chitinispirillaceae bacterium]|nr:glycosyltransferase family 2 protein [Chitinispirillaceae bacterium]
MPKVSVIIPTRNRCQTLARAIKSVVGQAYRDFEIIVVNDGSTDETARYLSFLDVPSLISVNLDRSQGGGGARNEGIKRSRGDYIAFLDDDDAWERSKLTEQVALLEAKAAGLCYTGKRVFDSKGRLINYTYKKPRFGDPYRSIMNDNFIGATSSVMVKKRFVDLVKGFDPDLRALQDWDFYIRLIKNGCTLAGIDKPLVDYYFMNKAKNVSFNAGNHLDAAQRMKKKYAGDPAWGLLNRSLTAVTVKKALKSWGFLKGLVERKRR